jgi:hypothetical protein
MHKQLEKKNDSLLKALIEIKTLQGFIPMCSWCKKIRDDAGFWNQVDEYFAERSDATFCQGICPDCIDKGPSA